MTLPDLVLYLGRLGVRLWIRSADGAPPKLVVGAPAAALSAEMRAGLEIHRDRLVAMLARVEYGSPPADPLCGWRRVVERWPVAWRDQWARRVHELEGRGLPWDWSEWTAFCETADDMVEAARREEGAPGMPQSPGVDRHIPIPTPGVDRRGKGGGR
jgi:hypothetical protein